MNTDKTDFPDIFIKIRANLRNQCSSVSNFLISKQLLKEKCLLIE